MSNNHLNTENQSQAPVFKWGAATHVGNVRTSNQDKYGIASNLLAVADGSGGHNGGEVAAEIAVTTLTASSGFQSINEFAYLVQMAHHLIQARAQENINLDKALEWMNKAIEMNESPRFWQYRQQSLIMAANDKFADAVDAAKKSLNLAIEADNQDYIKMNRESIAEWSKKL